MENTSNYPNVVRAVAADPSAKLAIDKAKKPAARRVPQYKYRRAGAPVMHTPADGAVVFHEHDELLTLDGERELAPEKVLGFATYSVERTAEDGYVDWIHESYPFGMHGDIERWFAIVWPDGCVDYMDGRCQTQAERIRLLRAKQRFERGE
jgi:hypothetical protein